MVVPAMIDTTSVDVADEGPQRRAGVAKHLRLDRDDQRRDGAGILRLRD